MKSENARMNHLKRIINNYLPEEKRHYEENPTEDHIYHSLVLIKEDIKTYEEQEDDFNEDMQMLRNIGEILLSQLGDDTNIKGDAW